MPPSGRKGKTRARRAPAAEPHEPSDVETPEAIATPSRSSRKRARAADAPAQAPRNTRRKVKDTRTVDREDTEGTEAHENSDAETEPALPSEAEIIAHLKVADRQVNATEDFANDLLEGQEHVPGYGKIAGRDWAFIIRKIEVNIGRPEAHERIPVEEGGQQSGPTAKTVVDIDLGPDRQVSRSHAIISYDSDAVQWFIIVNGRNGLRVDNNLLRRGAKSYLRNGAVIEIANTQMAFITTSNDDSEGPIWDGSIIRQAQKSSEDDDDGEDDRRLNNFRTMGLPGARASLQDSSAYGPDLGGQQRRTHPHSQQAMQAAPGTPMRNQQAFMKSSPGGANYSRGVMMESTETIDYADDSAKDLKPPHSYAQLIGMAILSTHEQQMTLNNIYKWIMANYAFYRFNTGGWQNSIRHNLSLNKAFTKIARRTDEPGKGMKWMIEPSEFDNFVQQGMKGCRRPNPMPGTQSTFGSPNSPANHLKQSVNGMKRDEDITPPLNAYRPVYPTAMEAYTPDRGSKRTIDGGVGLGINGDGPEYDYQTRSTPRNNLTAIANAAGSPPALFVNEDSHVGTLTTPFPFRPTQRFPPPSTLKRPSDFIQFSSPAPFWKMEGLAGSTPFKPYDNSPIKTPFSGFKRSETEVKDEGEAGTNGGEKDSTTKDAEQDAEPKPKGSPVINSSSPPRPNTSGNALDASPMLSRPATAVAKTLSQLAAASKESVAEESGINGGASESQDQSTNSVSAAPAQGTQATSVPASGSNNSQTSTNTLVNGYTPQPTTNHGASYSYTSGSGQPNGYHDDGEEDGIDLAK
jgi:pSer/pThr/pTyr-binding forkhead associated (FHA) protein